MPTNMVKILIQKKGKTDNVTTDELKQKKKFKDKPEIIIPNKNREKEDSYKDQAAVKNSKV